VSSPDLDARDHPLIIIGALPEPPIAELDAVAAQIMDAAARGEPLGPLPLTFLLRHYLATGHDDLAAVVGGALAAAFEPSAAERDVVARAAWLVLFCDATALSDDERLLASAGDLLRGLRDDWPSATRVADAAASVDACMRAADAASLVDSQDLVPAAIDQLERIVAGAYRPGGGMAATLSAPAHVRGSAADQVRSAAALLTAFERSGRLPYSMLAEELIQPFRGANAVEDVVIACESARVLSRVAALHADPDYRRAAVVAVDADYRREAEPLLALLSPRARAAGLDAAAAYGLALGEWLATAPDLQ
jgi:hypothetical protein